MPVTLSQETPWQRHVRTWSKCEKCDLCHGRSSVVLARGSLPCQVLFVGEAPGESEDALGQPFVGPAGQLLDRIIEDSLPADVRYALTNLICCIPREDDGGKAAAPLPEHIMACAERLRELVDIASPKLIVCVGSLARDYLDHSTKDSVWARGSKPRNVFRLSVHEGAKIPRAEIVHPAFILRANIAQRGLAIQRCVVTISNAVEKVLSGKNA